jgi:hypothetical protein
MLCQTQSNSLKSFKIKQDEVDSGGLFSKMNPNKVKAINPGEVLYITIHESQRD